MKMPQPIPYQGSKRALAQTIIDYYPNNIHSLIEPFAGSAAISIASLYYNKVDKVIINDINKPLMDLWGAIINNPNDIIEKYSYYWNEQLGDEKNYYNLIRDKFNETKESGYLLYLLARCVKAAVRYNTKGEFNQSPDNRRKGKHPKRMANEILNASSILNGKTEIFSTDYRDIIFKANEKDLVYMDPPYEGVSNKRDNRYMNGLGRNEFIESLEILNDKNIKYIISYDGRLGNKKYGELLPEHLKLKRIELEVGRSSQATLNNNTDMTYESIYLSENIFSNIDKLEIEDTIFKSIYKENKQMTLFG